MKVAHGEQTPRRVLLTVAIVIALCTGCDRAPHGVSQNDGRSGLTDPPSTSSSAPPPAPSQVRVAVLNSGSGCNNAAHINAAGLRALGFNVIAIDSLETADPDLNLPASVIEYPHELAAEAAVLAEAAPLARRIETSRVSVVTLKIGANQAGVRGVTPTHVTDDTLCDYTTASP